MTTNKEAGLTAGDIKRITYLIRALYVRQEVVIWPHQSLTNPYHLHSSDLFGDLEDSYLQLRGLKTLTDDEIISLQFRDFPENIEVTERKHFEDSTFFSLTIKRPYLHEGKAGYFNELISFHYGRSITVKNYQWLIQNGFAYDFYDAVTNTTITVEQQIEYGIIKLKEE